MVITVYKFDPSPPARAVLMTADILGLKIDAKDVNTLAGNQHTPEYLEKNPLHKVPLLEEGDFILADSHAIITYLVSKYGADKRATYYPSDMRIRATVDQRLYFDATVLFASITKIVISVLVDKAAAVSAENLVSVNESYAYAEKYLERSAFIAADHITIADVSCLASLSSLDSLVPIGEEFPKLREWLGKLQNQEWYQRANAPGLTQFADLVKHAMARNADTK